MIRSASVTLVVALAAFACAAPALAAGVAATGQTVSPIQASVRAEVARRVAAESAVSPLTGAQRRQPRRSWIQRHPVCSAAIIGFGLGYLMGYLPGDDAVLDDFTAEFNGVVIGGIGAGGAAATVAIVQAVRK